MTDIDKANLHHQQEQQFNTIDHKISTLINQIYEQLISLREDDIELTEQLTSIYDGLCQLRQTLTNPSTTSNADISTIPIYLDASSALFYETKPRSDSEPNRSQDRQRIVTIVEDRK